MAFRNPLELSKQNAVEFYNSMFDQVEYLDQAGFDTIWITEHHFVDDGYLSAAMPMLAAMAARTRHIKIGSFVILGPFYHPLRLAEDAVLIDVIFKWPAAAGYWCGLSARRIRDISCTSQ
jgi:alkanesulfonate monooxygenase SsuD/methylene tetrahydromethanopterin reductase-like flavin-dependent oxidoreductase (luciferase family)